MVLLSIGGNDQFRTHSVKNQFNVERDCVPVQPRRKRVSLGTRARAVYGNIIRCKMIRQIHAFVRLLFP